MKIVLPDTTGVSKPPIGTFHNVLKVSRSNAAVKPPSQRQARVRKPSAAYDAGGESDLV